MNILLVDGNDKKSSEDYLKTGMLPQYDLYKEVLLKLSSTEINVCVIHPTWTENFMEIGSNLDDFEGVVWTGSALNIYDSKLIIQRQIDLAKVLLGKKNKMFGSCWGLQVLVTAAGGKVRKNPKGLEAIIAKNIQLNDAGIKHPMYTDKPKNFDSFCWHYDEVELLPENSIILASNNFSDFQSMSFIRNKSEVWGVQYHPEFNPDWISGLMLMRKSVLIEKKIYQSEKEFLNIYDYLFNTQKIEQLSYNNFDISDTLIEERIRYREIDNWLKYLKTSF